MADRIKGIKVEIGGDTTGLKKALTDVNKEINNTQSQLKDIERLLKLDPKNVELLRQKQQLLTQSVSETKDKLDTLKIAEKQVQDQFSQGKISQQQYDGLQREIVETEEKLKGLENQAKSSNVTLSQIATTSSNLAAGAGKVSSGMAPATLAIAGLGAAAFSAAAHLEESQNKVAVVFGESAKSVTDFANTTIDSFGIAESTALNMAATFGNMGTSMGLSTQDAANMSTSLVGLAGDLASFNDIGLDQATTALNGIFTGETESLKSLGIVMTQTNLDAFALSNGFGKVTKDMTESEKVNLRFAYVTNSTKNAQGDFAETVDSASNSIKAAGENAKQMSAELGQVLLPIITPLIQKVTELIKWFSGLDENTKKTIVTIALLVAAISPVMGIISAIGGAISFICANPIVILIAAIVALVALIATKGDEIQAVLKKVDDFMQNIFATDFTKTFGVLGNILNVFFHNFKSMWNGIKSILDGIINIIRGVFTGDWSRAWEGVKEVFSGIFNNLVTIAKAPLNGIIGLLNCAIDAINSLIDGFNSIGFTMPKWLGGGSWHPSLPSIPSIPLLAKGGTVLSGSAIVGEAGAELLTVTPQGTRVEPLSHSQSTTTYGNVQISVYASPGQDINELANIVADKVDNAIHRKGGVFA